MATSGKTIFKKDISTSQCKDAGMALTLIFVIVGLFFKQQWAYPYAFTFLIIDMIMPRFFKYWGIYWYGLAETLGAVSSKILLTLVFVFVVTPVALIRKLLKKDKLQLKTFKKDTLSVMVKRNHLFTKKDIEQPF